MSNVTMSNVTKNSVWLKILSMLAEVVGCVSLYLGTGMLLVVPGGPGEPYLDRRMVAYGIAPTILSAILFLLAGWLWSQCCPKREAIQPTCPPSYFSAQNAAP